MALSTGCRTTLFISISKVSRVASGVSAVGDTWRLCALISTYSSFVSMTAMALEAVAMYAPRAKRLISPSAIVFLITFPPLVFVFDSEQFPVVAHCFATETTSTGWVC